DTSRRSGDSRRQRGRDQSCRRAQVLSAASDDIHALMQQIGRAAADAAGQLALADTAAKNRALNAAAAALRADGARVLAANAADLHAAQSAGLNAAMLDRLKLDQQRLDAIAEG